jgi:uncharacterized membrane protein
VTDPSGTSWRRGPAGWGTWGLLAFTVVALAGYGVFGMNPHLIPAELMGFWQVSYSFFARVHILLGALALAMAVVPEAGIRWLPSLVAVYLLSLLAEFVGTGYGFPFGSYEYTALLGARIGGRVPWVIPLSWFLMALPSWVLARTTFPGAGHRVARIAFAAVLLTLWDLPLDPAMSYQAPFYWMWGDAGPYYGMPWINLVGWMATGIVLMVALEGLGIARWGTTIPAGWALAYYAITVLMPFGMLLLEGLWLGVGVTVASYLAAWSVHLAFVGRRGRGPMPLAVTRDPDPGGAAAAAMATTPPTREGV